MDVLELCSDLLTSEALFNFDFGLCRFFLYLTLFKILMPFPTWNLLLVCGESSKNSLLNQSFLWHLTFFKYMFQATAFLFDQIYKDAHIL